MTSIAPFAPRAGAASEDCPYTCKRAFRWCIILEAPKEPNSPRRIASGLHPGSTGKTRKQQRFHLPPDYGLCMITKQLNSNRSVVYSRAGP
jgi:hypothetical protein